MRPYQARFGTTLNDGTEWYALYTRHRHEKAAAQILSNRGFDVFLPLYPVVHQWKDRLMHLKLPLFPCYVFLRGGLDRRLDILTTPGIFSFVGFGGRPATVPWNEIEAVRRAVERSERVEPHPYLQCGDQVRLKSGPLEGLEGILIRKKNLARLILSIGLLERSIAAEVNAWEVERISKQESCTGSHLPSPWSAAHPRQPQEGKENVSLHRA